MQFLLHIFVNILIFNINDVDIYQLIKEADDDFWIVCCSPLYVLLCFVFFVAIALSVLRITASNNSIGIFIFFLFVEGLDNRSQYVEQFVDQVW